MALEIITATGRHIADLFGRLREADRQEIAASTGREPDRALAVAFGLSSLCRVVLAGGCPVAVFGVVPASEMVGIPWLLGSDDFIKVSLAAARHSREQVADMLKPFDRLENYIDVRNSLSKRWLEWCGFQFDAPEAWGVAGLPFQRFWIRKTSHV